MINLLKKLLIILILLSLSFSYISTFIFSKHIYEKELNISIIDKNNEKYALSIVQGTTFGDIKEIIDDYDIEFRNIFGMNEPLYDGEILDFSIINQDNLISINTNDIKSLTSLPRIGINTANKIIDYRKRYGDFKYLDELKNVSGIGDKKFENIKKYLTF